MKKLIALLLVIVLSLTGCASLSGNGNNDNGGLTDGFVGDCDGTTHVDTDDDGYCDSCLESVVIIIDLFALNDLHGKITPSESQSGVGGLTTYLKSVLNENSILFSTGDMWQGSSESNLTHGALMTDWMSELGFVSMTLGNHEYDWGQEDIIDNAELADFPFLAINVYDKATNERVEYAQPSVVVSRGGIEIGIIGAMGNCYSSISGEVSGDFYFKTGKELTDLVKAESDRLKAEGVEFIVYSIHDGYEYSNSSVGYATNGDLLGYYDISLSGDYVDIVFEAHTHQSYILSDSKGVYHLQGGGENSGLSTAKLRYNTANNKKSVISPKIVKASAYKNLAKDPIVNTLLEKYAEIINKAYEVLGNNVRYRDDSEVEQIVANLYYQYGVEKWGSEYDIILGGGFIRTRNPYNLKAGSLTYSDVYSLLPFDNDLVLCTISGRDLYNKFINTDNSDYYICYGSNSVSNIDFNKTYYIVTDTYTSTYSYNNLTEVARYTPGVSARDLFAEFVKAGGLN